MSSYGVFALLLISVVLQLLTSPTFAFAETNDRKVFLSSKTDTENVIRELNLFPKNNINIAEDKSMTNNGPRIVEKRLLLSPLSDSGATVQDLAHHTGYFRLSHTNGARMFYYFFKSRNNRTDPVVIWLTGGPGCGSEVALFYENGPFQITNNLSLVWNDFGWDKVSNIIYVDQPIGTGFSYSTNVNDIRHDEVGISNDLYEFLQAFFKKHPKYVKNDFYITGESYAGHYVPAFAARVHQGNKNREGMYINLKGFAIGNGLTNPDIQYKALPDYALSMNLINQTEYNNMSTLNSQCDQAIKLCGTTSLDTCTVAFNVCNTISSTIIRLNNGTNRYDIRKKCEVHPLCYDFSNMGNFLDQAFVREALGVGTIPYVFCSTLVYNAMITDWMKNLEVGIPTLLEDGIKLLIYAGEYDLTCAWLGNSRWVEAMEWSGQKSYLSAPTVRFTVDGAEAGLKKNYGPLTFLKVHNAGHMVPMDQPQAALEMLQRWMQGKL